MKVIAEDDEVIARVTKLQWGHLPSAVVMLVVVSSSQRPVIAVFLGGLVATTILATADAAYYSRPTVRSIVRLCFSLGFCNAALLGVVACTPRSDPGQIELGAASLAAIILTPLIAAFVEILALLLHLMFTRVRAFRSFGCCSVCGYDLRATPGDRCSECGHLIDQSARAASPTTGVSPL